MTFPNSNSSSRLSPVGQTRGKSKEWSYVVDGMSFSCREEGKMWLSEHKFTCPFQYNGKYDECQSCPKCRDKNMIKTLTSANYNDNFHDKEQLQLQMQEKKSKGCGCWNATVRCQHHRKGCKNSYYLYRNRFKDGYWYALGNEDNAKSCTSDVPSDSSPSRNTTERNADREQQIETELLTLLPDFKFFCKDDYHDFFRKSSHKSLKVLRCYLIVNYFQMNWKDEPLRELVLKRISRQYHKVSKTNSNKNTYPAIVVQSNDQLSAEAALRSTQHQNISPAGEESRRIQCHNSNIHREKELNKLTPGIHWLLCTLLEQGLMDETAMEQATANNIFAFGSPEWNLLNALVLCKGEHNGVDVVTHLEGVAKEILAQKGSSSSHDLSKSIRRYPPNLGFPERKRIKGEISAGYLSSCSRMDIDSSVGRGVPVHHQHVSNSSSSYSRVRFNSDRMPEAKRVKKERRGYSFSVTQPSQMDIDETIDRGADYQSYEDTKVPINNHGDTTIQNVYSYSMDYRRAQYDINKPGDNYRETATIGGSMDTRAYHETATIGGSIDTLRAYQSAHSESSDGPGSAVMPNDQHVTDGMVFPINTSYGQDDRNDNVRMNSRQSGIPMRVLNYDLNFSDSGGYW